MSTRPFSARAGNARQISWDEFRLVKAIAEAQGLNGAADRLQLNHSTVFRRLNTLEEDLGATLFERGRNGYVLTASGEEMVALAHRMADDVTEFERKVAGRDLQPSGELRVTMADTMLTTFAARPLADFRQRYPEISLDINIENRALNLSQRDADVALRASNTPPDVLVGRRISTIAGAVYGPRSLADKPGLTPLTYDGPWVGFGDPIQNTTGARWVKANIPPEQIVVKVNGMIGLVEAVAAGLGVALLPCFTGEMRPDLVRIGDPIPEAASSLWLLTHPDLRRSARVRVFMDFFGAEISKMKHQLECVGAIPSR